MPWARQVYHEELSEGRACRVRHITFDSPFRFIGHDERAPPNLPSEEPACQVRSEEPACQVRRTTFDDPFHFCGRDKHAPPRVSPSPALPARGEGENIPPACGGIKGGCVSARFGGTRLSGPRHSLGLLSLQI